MMSKKITEKLKRKPIIVFLSVIILLLAIPALYATIFWGRIFPGVAIAGVKVGGLKEENALNKLSDSIQYPEYLIYTVESQEFKIPLDDIEFEYKLQDSINSAYKYHRTDNLLTDFTNRMKSLINTQNLPLEYELNEEKLRANISVIAGQISEEPVEPSITLSGPDIVVFKGQSGKDTDVDKIYSDTIKNLKTANFTTIAISLEDVDPSITDDEAQLLRRKAETLIQKELVLYYNETEIPLSDSQAVGLLAISGVNETRFQETLEILKKDVEREAQNAVFQFSEGRVEEFQPAKEGLKIDSELLKNSLSNSFTQIETYQEPKISIEIPLIKTQPEITTDEVNNLGIKELLGKGESTYTGSIASRVHNVDLAASKINGAIVAPGEVFSFNETIGDISVYTGYKQAYVIMGGKTVLGDGGGVCQVSTTVFRAALDAGLPIVERSPHSYRVGYYEQGYKAGLDATIYSPVTDLKFKNDTPGHILIQTISNSTDYYLAFEIYGTSDGRTSEITNHSVSAPIPPPEDLFIDDPTLPAGEVKQIDWAAWGAKAQFDYIVKKDGEVIFEKTFYSNYRPWQAKFLRGTGPEAPSPQT